MFNYNTAVSFISTILTVSCLAAFAHIILQIKPKPGPVLLYTLTAGILSGFVVIIAEYTAMHIKLVASFALMILFLRLLLKISFLRSFIVLGLFVILQALGNIVASAAFFAFGIDYVAAKYDTGNLIAANIIITIVNIVAFIIIKTFKLFSAFSKEQRRRANIIVCIYIAFTVLIIAVNFAFYYNIYRNYADRTGIIINTLLILGYLVFCVLSASTFFKLETKKQEIEYQKFYNRTLDYLMNDLRRFRHNYNNMLGVVASYLDSSSLEELKEYMAELIKENEISTAYSNLELINIKNAGILGVVMLKLQEAKKRELRIRTCIEGELKEVNIKISEICEIMGILLDNAIEAAAESKNKFFSLRISCEENIVTFVVENSVDEVPKIGELYKKGYSTKGRERGLGLWIVKSIIDKYSNVLLNTECRNNTFRQELIIT